MILIGAHSMAGTPDGVLSHTGNRNVVYRKVNDRIVGEIGTAILQAGEFGIKVIMVSGDVAACREAKDLNPNITTAAVKKGFDMYHAECLHPEKARELIYNKVCEAFEKADTIEIMKPESPVIYEEKYGTTDPLEGKANTGFMKILDEYTVQYYGKSLCEAHARRCGLEIK
jgi:D-amino peptidase